MKKTSSLKISISGVRGIIGDSLTPQLAAALAQAFGSYVGGGEVLVGRDARASGPMLEQAVVAGLLASGCQPVEAGICPIPSFLVLTRERKAAGGIAVTASHNPKEWNGLKFISRAGLYLTPLQTEEFLDIYHQGEFTSVGPERLKSVKVDPHPVEPHLKRLLAHFDVELIRRRRFKVAVDCGNGAGGMLAPRFLEALGCETLLLNAEPDGSFTRPSEPTPEAIGQIRRATPRAHAAAGFVQDADADRLALVDERGEALGEELTLALAADYVLGRKKGSVVCNLSTTRALDDIAAAHKAPIFRTKIGEINVVEKVLAADPPAVIAGEGNGGVILPEIHPCRDSFAGMGLVLEAMAASGKKLSELRARVPRYVMIKEKIEGSAEQAHRLIGLLKRSYEGQGRVSLLDGLKVDFADHWIHVRPSNTEPIIRVIAEARTAAAAKAAVRALKERIAELHKRL